MNDPSFNWAKFLLLLAAKITVAFSTLTRRERVKVFALDDSVIKRNRSKAVELLARVYDHVEHKYQKGFSLLTLGWSDGYSTATKARLDGGRLKALGWRMKYPVEEGARR